MSPFLLLALIQRGKTNMGAQGLSRRPSHRTCARCHRFSVEWRPGVSGPARKRTKSLWHATNSARCCVDALFRGAARRWLRVPTADQDSACPHGLVCPCGGAVFRFAAAVGLKPELEKRSLLEPRLFDGALPKTGSERPTRVPAALLMSKSLQMATRSPSGSGLRLVCRPFSSFDIPCGWGPLTLHPMDPQAALNWRDDGLLKCCQVCIAS